MKTYQEDGKEENVTFFRIPKSQTMRNFPPWCAGLIWLSFCKVNFWKVEEMRVLYEKPVTARAARAIVL